jgi:phosphoglycolate phosphatase-like HAD superfamily hydrolase
MTQYLVLFDVDGTLLLTHDDLYVEASRASLKDVYGIVPEAADTPGDTAIANTRRALRTAGCSDDEIDSRLAAWCAAFSRRYVDLLCTADTSGWVVAPGAGETLPRIERRALLTGNPEDVARARMERMGLAEVFPIGHGAFGCERERRVELFDLARRREDAWPASRTVAVGDTPLDVETAHAAGGLVVAVTTGRYEASELSGADAVVERLIELPEVLASL